MSTLSSKVCMSCPRGLQIQEVLGWPQRSSWGHSGVLTRTTAGQLVHFWKENMHFLIWPPRSQCYRYCTGHSYNHNSVQCVSYKNLVYRLAQFPVASWLGSLNRIPKVKGSTTVQELKYLPSSSQRVNLTFFLRYVVCDDKYCYSKYSVSSFDRLW